MTSALSNWYHHQYSSWNRTRRMQAAPFLARTESQTARVAQTASRLQTTDTVINMSDLLEGGPDRLTHGKKQDTLFGPSIGIVDPGPSWTDNQQNEKPPLQDVLTPELVKSWIEKSKEASQPTTTLQALVNLKRPSLKLAPILHGDDPGDAPAAPHHHGLEFQFDCDAPKCGISLHVAGQDVSSSSSSSSSSSPRLINLFNMVVEGGFGRVLKLEEGATLELDKYDPHAAATSDVQPSSASDKSAAPSSSPSHPTPPPAAQDQQHHPRKRFTLRIRRRTHPHAAEDRNQVSVAGPALQVVDMEGHTQNGADAASSKDHKDEQGGVRVMIQLEALDEHEHGLASVNSQTTYLHIVRVGPPPTPPTPDTRPWVVRVVKREATIGPHTFHLHEIYGLTSHTSAHPPSQADAQSHTYPPSTQPIDDDPTSECLLCLSSPREVVLLPCRHLVACKECAMNMVEFGAGGQLVHNEEPPPPAAAADPIPGESAGDGSGVGNTGSGGDDDGATAAPAPTAAPTGPVPPLPQATRSRRKRKPKGWFCPVCRQPYTSLLRISTAAPVKTMEGGEVAPSATPPSATTPGSGTPVPAPARTGLLAAISNAMTGSGNNSGTNPTGVEAV